MEEQPRKFYLSVSNLGEPLYDDIVNSDLPREEKVKQIKWRGQAYRDELDDQLHKDYARIGLGGLVSAIGALPIAITKNPVIGSAIGGGVYELGQGIMEGDELPELMQRAGWGGAIGGTVGGAVSKLPDAARFVNNLSGGRIGEGVNNLANRLASNRKVLDATRGLNNFLNTDINKLYNPFKTESKVLYDILMDENGNPLNLLHGTSNIFDNFDKRYLGSLTNSKSAKQGFWFTDGTKTAKSYADYSAENSGINKLLKQQNIAEKTGKWDEYDRLTEEIEALALNSEKPTPRIIEANLDMNTPVSIDAQGKRFMDIQDDINKLIENNPNADGFIIKNLDDVTDNNFREVANHYMVRNPEQIKIRDIKENGKSLYNKLIDNDKIVNQPLKYKGEQVKIDIDPQEKNYIISEITSNMSKEELANKYAVRRLYSKKNKKDYFYELEYDPDGMHKINQYEVNENDIYDR